jgi:hypothetical protein
MGVTRMSVDPYLRNTPLTNDQMVRLRDFLQRDVVSEQAADIAALTRDAVTQAAVTSLDPARYVRVTLMPDGGQ